MREVKAQRDELLSMAVASSKDLDLVEKETCMNVLGSELSISVLSYHPTVTRGLLRQPEFQPESAYIEKQGRRQVLVGISGRLPISCLHIGAARRRGTLSGVFSRRSSTRKASNCAATTQRSPHESLLFHSVPQEEAHAT